MATDLTGLTGKIQAIFRATGIKAIDLDSLQDPLSKTYSTTITFGTDDDQADLLWHQRDTLVADANENWDLQSLTGSFGIATSFAKIKAILIDNVSTTEAVLDIGNAGATEWIGLLKAANDIFTLPAGACLLATYPGTGYAVAGGSKNLKVLETASLAAIYDIVVVGLSS